MRVNEPVTNREVFIPDGATLVSGTDTKGRIVFSNHAFVAISGFSESELIGAPHNLIRHPHMPKEAFADLWATIKAGRPWDGLVKNRTKTGDFYWVRANVTPVFKGSEVTGYVSVRSKPTREQVASAERTYAAIHTGKARGIGLRDGEIVATGWRAGLVTACRSVTGRMAGNVVMLVLALGLVGGIGLSDLHGAKETLRTTHNDRTVAVAELGGIVDHMRANLQRAALLVIDLRAAGNDPAARQAATASQAEPMRASIAGITEAWARFTASAPRWTPEEMALAAQFAERRGAFLREGLEPVLALAGRSEAEGLERHLRERALPLFNAAHGAMLNLVALQSRRAGEVLAAEEARFRRRAGGFAAVMLLAGLGLDWLRGAVASHDSATATPA